MRSIIYPLTIKENNLFFRKVLADNLLSTIPHSRRRGELYEPDLPDDQFDDSRKWEVAQFWKHIFLQNKMGESQRQEANNPETEMNIIVIAIPDGNQ